METENIIITIWTYSNGLVGRKYETIREAIIDDGFSAWNKEKIKKAFNFGNGTMADFNRFIKDNNEFVIPTEKFFQIVDSLPNATTYYEFINKTLHQ